MVITTGAGPQEKVITPPLATAATTAADVQLAAVPSPTTVVGCEVSAGCAAAGIGAWPFGLPKDDGAAGDPAVVVAAVAVGVAAGFDADVEVPVAEAFDGDGDVADAPDDEPGEAPEPPAAGASEPEVAEFPAFPPCAVLEEEEPQAVAPTDTAAAMTTATRA